MRQFCNDSDYKDIAMMDKTGQHMQMDDPIVLAAFVAFCSGNRQRIFFRGAVKDYPNSFPSLFRDRKDSDRYKVFNLIGVTVCNSIPP